jgi:hypothetical protein
MKGDGPMTSSVEKVSWFGRPIDALSYDELLSAFRTLAEWHVKMRASHDESLQAMAIGLGRVSVCPDCGEPVTAAIGNNCRAAHQWLGQGLGRFGTIIWTQR